MSPLPDGTETGGALPFAGQWFDKGAAVFNAMHPDFGAKGDGTTDDTAALQGWLDTIRASNGTTGYLPNGTYRITSPLTVTLINRQAFNLIGSGSGQTTTGPGTRIILANDLSSASTYALTIDCASLEARVTIEGIAFIGDSNSGSGLRIHNCNQRVSISRCVFSGFTSGTGLALDTIVGIHLLGVHCETNATGFAHAATGSEGEGAIVSCKFAGCTTDLVALADKPGASSFLSFIGCTFFGFTGNDDGRVSIGDGAFCIGFHDCSFEQSFLFGNTNDNISCLTVEGCFFSPTVESGQTQFCIDIDELVYSRIQNCLFNPTIAGTGGGITLGSNSKFNVIGPNKFSFTGAGTGTTYTPGDMGALHCTKSIASVGGQPDADISVVRLDTSDVLQIENATSYRFDAGVVMTDTLTVSNKSTLTGPVGIGGATAGTISLTVQEDTSGEQAIEVEHTHATPLGLNVLFSGGAPNDQTQWYLRGQDTSTTRFTIFSDGTFSGGAGIFNDTLSVTGVSTLGALTTITGPDSGTDAFTNPIIARGATTSGAADTGSGITFSIHTGSGYRQNAWIRGLKENSTGGNDATYLSLGVRAAGGSPEEAVRISSTKAVSLLSTLAVTGFSTFSAGLEVKSTAPDVRWCETDAGTDEKEWDIAAAGGVMIFRVLKDDRTSPAKFMEVTRTANVVDLVDFGGTAFSVAGTLTVTGIATASAGVIIGTGISAAAKIYLLGTQGMVIQTGTGSANDFLLATPAGAAIMAVPTGTDDVQFSGTLAVAGDIGFYGQAATAKPTGVAVTDVGIHAALVTLNLIAA